MHSHREHVGKEAGEDREDDEPRPDEDEDATAPSLDRWRAHLHGGDCAFLGGRERQSQGEHEDDDRERGHDEGEVGGTRAAGRERLSGQTGQDRTGSPKAGEEVTEAEEDEAEDRVAAAKTRLATEEAVSRGLEASQVHVQSFQLNQPEDDQQRSHDAAYDPTGRARERDIFEQRTTAERDEETGEQQEGARPHRQRGRETGGSAQWRVMLGLSVTLEGAGEHGDEQGKRAGREKRGHAGGSRQHQQPGAGAGRKIESRVEDVARVPGDGERNCPQGEG